jgi:CheY-like chemotaxis protein
MNLGTNAAHAMRDSGGVLEVRMEPYRVEMTEKTALSELRPGQYVRLTVSDTGHGMTPEVMARIFEPFFTTKSIGEGTGMGLAVIHGIITNHDGAITVESTPGNGTTFRVYLPTTEITQHAEEAPDEPLPGGTERILFVDDEEALVQLGQRLLTRLGYTVTACQSSVEALQRFQQAPQTFDLVMTDQTMPEMTGEQLSYELRQLQLDIPIIMCTGFSRTRDAATWRAAGIDALCMKPLVARQIARTIRQVLDLPREPNRSRSL